MTTPAKRASSPEETAAQQRILDIIVGQDDVSWKGIIFGLIETNQMDPWDINISLIAERFIQELRKLQQMDFRIGGKVVLASAILLKMKAERLYGDELGALDSLIQTVESQEDPSLLDAGEGGPRVRPTIPSLTPRTPQPRKRKVSVYDLIEALEQALEMEARRPPRIAPRVLDTINPPDHHIDISKVIQEVYRQIFDHYETRKEIAGSLAFSHLVKGDTKRDHVLAFIPLLHLENARKIDLDQQAHFGPITVHLIDPTAPVFEQPKTEDSERTKKERVRKQKEEAKKKQQTTLAPLKTPQETRKARPAVKTFGIGKPVPPTVPRVFETKKSTPEAKAQPATAIAKRELPTTKPGVSTKRAMRRKPAPRKSLLVLPAKNPSRAMVVIKKPARAIVVAKPVKRAPKKAHHAKKMHALKKAKKKR